MRESRDDLRRYMVSHQAQQAVSSRQNVEAALFAAETVVVRPSSVFVASLGITTNSSNRGI
jgi:hypothetical protein